MTKKEELNSFFVSCFNHILQTEESALEAITNSKLTMKEIHFIEAVFKAKARDENCSTTIASMLGVTMGTLSASFARLERKGYLTKERCEKDKRIFFINPTRLAELINEEHLAFHSKMIDSIMQVVPDDKFETLLGALKALDAFFENYNDN